MVTAIRSRFAIDRTIIIMVLSMTKMTSCPYYNVKLSYVFLKLPLLTYSDYQVTFTNPKLTNIQ